MILLLSPLDFWLAFGCVLAGGILASVIVFERVFR